MTNATYRFYKEHINEISSRDLFGILFAMMVNHPSMENVTNQDKEIWSLMYERIKLSLIATQIIRHFIVCVGEFNLIAIDEKYPEDPSPKTYYEIEIPSNLDEAIQKWIKEEKK